MDELQQQNQKLHPDSCTLLEALSLNDTFLAAEIVRNPNQKHKGTRCAARYVYSITFFFVRKTLAARSLAFGEVFADDLIVF